jgi:hypothetical protein
MPLLNVGLVRQVFIYHKKQILNLGGRTLQYGSRIVKLLVQVNVGYLGVWWETAAGFRHVLSRHNNEQFTK